MLSATIIATGNVLGDAEIKVTANGKSVTRLRVAVNERVKVDGVWQDATSPSVLECEAWESFAENLADSVKKGDRVVVTGSVTVNAYTGRDGSARAVLKVKLEDLGISVRFHPAASRKTERTRPAAADDHDQWTSEPPF